MLLVTCVVLFIWCGALSNIPYAIMFEEVNRKLPAPERTEFLDWSWKNRVNRGAVFGRYAEFFPDGPYRRQTMRLMLATGGLWSIAAIILFAGMGFRSTIAISSGCAYAWFLFFILPGVSSSWIGVLLALMVGRLNRELPEDQQLP